MPEQKKLAPNPNQRLAETTKLSPLEEALFKAWAKASGIEDVDNSESAYDYKGYYKSVNGKIHPRGEHFPDTFKQHGHETFSIESKYSRGPFDGGMWIGETFLPQMEPKPSHEGHQMLSDLHAGSEYKINDKDTLIGEMLQRILSGKNKGQ